MANLVGVADRRRGHRHHRGQGQGPAPHRREADHQGQEGRPPQPPPGRGLPGDEEMASKLFDDIGPRYEERPGGYTRILKLGPPPRRQRPDGAHRAGLSRPGGTSPPVTPVRRSPAEAGDGSTSTSAPPRVRLLVAYDGSGFHGFAPNEGVTTVGGTLTAALEQVLRRPIELTCAGRTDAGVHAWGQVVSFDAPGRRPRPRPAPARRSTSCAGRPSSCARPPRSRPDFDARFSARSRVYRYTVLNRPVPDPFLPATTWYVAEPLDLRAMLLACDPLIGEHDFSSFCRAAQGRPRARSRPRWPGG